MLNKGDKIAIKTPFRCRRWQKSGGRSSLVFDTVSPATDIRNMAIARVDHACQSFCRVSWKIKMFRKRRSAIVDLNEITFQATEEDGSCA